MQRKKETNLLSNRLYDVLKWVTMIGLPAIGTALLAISEIWNVSYGSEVAETINVIILMLGTMVGVSTAQYNRKKTIEKPEGGVLEVGTDGTDVTLDKLEIDMSPEEIATRDEIVFRIRKN